MQPRRDFLKALAALPLAGCLDPLTGRTGGAVDSTPLEIGQADVGAGSDLPETWEVYLDLGAELQPELEVRLDAGEGVWPVTIDAPFQVYLADLSCSGHPHQAYIEPGTWSDNTPVVVYGGHPTALRPLEMKALEQGEQIPFHTLPHAAHHHCGTAVRMDVFEDEFDKDETQLEDFFECVVPETAPELPPDWSDLDYGFCVVQ